MLLSHNLVLHGRTKHIEMDILFVRECVFYKKLLIQHIPNTTQIVDTLNKSLGSAAFQDLRSNLKVTSEGHPS